MQRLDYPSVTPRCLTHPKSPMKKRAITVSFTLAMFWRGRDSATFSPKKCKCRIKICRHAIFVPLKL